MRTMFVAPLKPLCDVSDCPRCTCYSGVMLAGVKGWCIARGTRPTGETPEWRCFKERM